MITVVPGGGLANRIGVIDSCYFLSSKYDSKLKVIWIRDSGLNCSFHDLFDKPDKFVVEEFNWTHLNAYPNYWQKKVPMLRTLVNKSRELRYDRIILNTDIIESIQSANDNIFENLEKLRVYIDGCIRFASKFNIADWLNPLNSINELANHTIKQFGKSTFGIHIRRTDNIMAIESSSLDYFENEIDKIITKDDDAKFFIATDDDSIKDWLIENYGDRILYREVENSRNTKEGIIDALIDFICLSKTRSIIGSAHSTFSLEAAYYGDIKITLPKS